MQYERPSGDPMDRPPAGLPAGPGGAEEPVPGGLTGRVEAEFELLQRHVLMLKAVMDHQPIGIIRLSEITGYPQHKVRYSLRVLEQEGLIEPSPQGAVVTGKVHEFLPNLRGLLTSMTEIVAQLRKAIE
jgi:predicted transcriptional regulator